MPPELSGHPEGYILLTSLLRAFVGELFPGLEMLGCYQWRVTRNSDLFVDEEEVTNLRHALQASCRSAISAPPCGSRSTR